MPRFSTNSLVGASAGAALAAAAAAWASPAVADGYARPGAGYYRSGAPECAAQNFHGAYIGGHAGLGLLSWVFDDRDAYAAGQRSHSGEILGSTLGLQAGYNWARCSMLLGVEWDFSWGNIAKGRQYDDGGVHLSQSLGYLSSIRGNVGYAVDNWLVYGTIGVALGGFESVYTPTRNSSNAFEIDGARIGVVVGAGAEYALSHRLRLTGNVLLYDFGTRDSVHEHEGFLGGHLPGQKFDFKDGFSVIVTRFGVNFHFGDGAKN